MTLRRLEILQWLGLFLGGGAWAAQFVAGYGSTEAECGAAGASWALPHDRWQVLLMVAGALLVLVAGAAAVSVVRQTRGVSYEADGPPLGRIRFFAIAAVVANVLFLTIVLLSTSGALAAVGCRQS